MEPLAQSLELQLREEATKRMLAELYDEGNLDGLMAAAELLNTLWHQQSSIAKWLAHEAAANLGEAWEASRRS